MNEKNAAQYNALFAKAYQELAAAGKLREGMENDEGRFLSIDDYFAHMADLLLLNPTYMMLPLDETTFDINANNRAISAPKIVILQNDQIAETVIFTIDRYFDYMDLNNAEIWVQWSAPGKNGTIREGSSRIEMKDIASVPGKIRLGWPLDSDITKEPGTVKYSVRFWNKGIVKNDETDAEEEKVVYSFNTLTSTLTISPSLQPEVDFTSVPNAPIRDNIFVRAIRNSQITSEGVAVPLEPLFSEPGQDLPIEASLVDDTLTLKAQATVGDTGHIAYEWYYKPAVDMVTENSTFNSNTFYSYEPRTIYNSDGTTTELPGFKEFNPNGIKEEYIPVEGLTALVTGEQYYVAASDTSSGYTAYTGTTVPENTTLYERYTTYTVPEGDIKVTGDYYVEATNYIRPNTSNAKSSRICKLISPDNVAFANNLPELAVIENEAGIDLNVKLVPQTSDKADITYIWRKSVESNVIDEDDEVIENENSNICNITTPGWYQVAAKVLLNREDKSATSGVCKVTFMPEVPSLDYTDEAKLLIPEDKTIPYYVSSDAELKVVVGSIIPEDYKGYSEKLFSDKLRYVWYVQSNEGVTRPVADADIESGLVVDGLGTPVLKVHSPGDDGYTFTCKVFNELNGITVDSGDNSLSFYIV